MKICIIKLGALGDVVRTLPIAEAVKKKYSESEITWITKKNALELFEGNPFVDKAAAIPYNNWEKLDILYNFDIEEDATNLAKEIKADRKFGFYSEGGFPNAFNLGAEYYLNTLFDDELKKTNRKTYQQMMFDAAELPYEKEMPLIYLTDEDRKYANEFLKENKIKTGKLIGIHIGGGGKRWPSKAWAENKIKEFVIKAKETGYETILFGGPDEVEKIGRMREELLNRNIIVYANNPRNSIKEFAVLVEKCDKIVCHDSLSLHISLALKKPTIGLFFCTTPHEVEDYGLLKKIISPLLYEFFPEKQDQFSEELINSISVDEVINILTITSNKNSLI